ncbi:MAG: hypothetical protein MUF45_07665, partial [Spirosomaceae bacterium]|nr:hypothetical protein [Spirosomataceae bacterium]
PKQNSNHFSIDWLINSMAFSVVMLPLLAFGKNVNFDGSGRCSTCWVDFLVKKFTEIIYSTNIKTDE